MTADIEFRARRFNDTPVSIGGYVRSPGACKRAGITYRQLDYWVVNYLDKLHVDVVDPEAGSGSWRWVRELDLPKLHTLGQLSRFGIIKLALELPPQERLRLCGTLRKMLRRNQVGAA